MFKKLLALLTCICITLYGIYYFWDKEKEVGMIEVVTIVNEVNPKPPTDDELPAQLKVRIDRVLGRVESMWDPDGSRAIEVGKKIEALEAALEDKDSKLAKKILSDIEYIQSQK